MKRKEIESRLAEAERRVFELRAQLASRIGAAFDAMPKTADSFMGSGIVLHVTALGGAEIVPPVVIRDGFSPASVAALQDDLRRSFEIATMAVLTMART